MSKMKPEQTEYNSKGKATMYVNSNVPLLTEDHLKLRIIALKQGRTLRDLLAEIVGDYLSKISYNE